MDPGYDHGAGAYAPTPSIRERLPPRQASYRKEDDGYYDDPPPEAYYGDAYDRGDDDRRHSKCAWWFLALVVIGAGVTCAVLFGVVKIQNPKAPATSDEVVAPVNGSNASLPPTTDGLLSSDSASLLPLSSSKVVTDSKAASTSVAAETGSATETESASADLPNDTASLDATTTSTPDLPVVDAPPPTTSETTTTTTTTTATTATTTTADATTSVDIPPVIPPDPSTRPPRGGGPRPDDYVPQGPARRHAAERGGPIMAVAVPR